MTYGRVFDDWVLGVSLLFSSDVERLAKYKWDASNQLLVQASDADRIVAQKIARLVIKSRADYIIAVDPLRRGKTIYTTEVGRQGSVSLEVIIGSLSIKNTLRAIEDAKTGYGYSVIIFGSGNISYLKTHEATMLKIFEKSHVAVEIADGEEYVVVGNSI